MVLLLPDSSSNWNFEMLVFDERGKPEYPEKNLLEQGREPTTNSTHIWRRHRDLNPDHIIHKVVLRLPDSWSNSNLEVLVFEELGKPEYPEKNRSKQGREPTTNSTHIWRRHRDLNPDHIIGGRRALSSLRHLLLPNWRILHDWWQYPSTC